MRLSAPRPEQPQPMRLQRGLTLLEVFLSVGIGLLLLVTAGFLFIGQVKGYRDIGSQAKLQIAAKNAVQSMATEIANTGACMADKRFHFTMGSSSYKFTYMDLKTRHCAETETVTVNYSVHNGGANGDTLLESVKCNSRGANGLALIKGQGPVTLNFTYYDVNGAVTAVAANVKSVEFSIDIKSPAGKSLFVRDRNPKVRVDLVN